MKQKSPRRRGLSFVKVHAFVFALFTLGASANIFLTLNANLDRPFSDFQSLIMQNISVILMWSIVLITHIALHQVRAFWEYRSQQSHLETVESIQERYESRSRLYVDSQGIDKDEIIDEQALHAAYQTRHNGRSR